MANRMVRRGYSSGATDMLSLRDMMGRLMENAFISPDQWFDEYGMRMPAIDVSENDDAYVVRAELPGWKPENIEITCEGNTVSLKGQLENEDQQNDGSTRWHHREMRRTSFERSITLPAEVEADKATADFENGVLTLRLPKSEEAKPRQIKIGSGQRGASQRTISQGNTGQGSVNQGSTEMGGSSSSRSSSSRGSTSRP